jgi:hypothetical protein
MVSASGLFRAREDFLATVGHVAHHMLDLPP